MVSRRAAATRAKARIAEEASASGSSNEKPDPEEVEVEEAVPVPVPVKSEKKKEKGIKKAKKGPLEKEKLEFSIDEETEHWIPLYEDETMTPYLARVEYAKSGRATCRMCCEKIDKATADVGRLTEEIASLDKTILEATVPGAKEGMIVTTEPG